MIQEEQDRLETAWRQIRPAAAPPELLARLHAARPVQPAMVVPPSDAPSLWRQIRLGWRALTLAAPTTAVLLLIWFAWAPGLTTKPLIPGAITGNSAPDNVQVGHSLVASFDTIARVPGGAPVRLRYREWQDNIVIHDRVHGMEITQTTPRIEVIPVRFETY
jgi:hypothetical protein